MTAEKYRCFSHLPSSISGIHHRGRGHVFCLSNSVCNFTSGPTSLSLKKLQKARPSVSNFYLTVILSITNYIITLFFFEFSSFEPAIIKPCWKSLLLVAAWTPSSNYYKITTVFLSGIFVLLRSLRRRNGNHFRLDSFDQCPLLEIPIKDFNQFSYKPKMWYLLRLLVYLKLQLIKHLPSFQAKADSHLNVCNKNPMI